MKKTIGIIGGMGPLATVYLFKKIVELTDAEQDDEHPRIVIDNNTSIPKRPNYLQGEGENPLPYLIETAKRLESIGADFLIMPCNTAHYFFEGIQKKLKIPLINMVEETAEYFISNNPKGNKVGLLATEATCEFRIYHDIFKKCGLEVITPTSNQQEFITDIINEKIKKGDNIIDLKKFNNIILDLNFRGAESVIIGCTELSVVNDLYNIEGDIIDAMKILSENAILKSGYHIKNNKPIGSDKNE
ncbi:aspartate/glutamate racemase family protein [Senegalia sp. (in: firmicutes)]|uniref:aspartate/glutamate racemase family protein n=1 Tax=Senegalia sp. (in: firmicutes) TaxID=1924098 RepID=UPI003F9E61D3